MSAPFLQIAKTWAGNDPFLVFQVTNRRSKENNLPKKFFLTASVAKKYGEIGFHDQKPEGLKPHGGVVGFFRKHIPIATIGAIYRDPETFARWVYLYRQNSEKPQWLLYISGGNFPEISLMDSDLVVHVTINRKGTYTKKKNSQIESPFGKEERFEDEMTRLLEPLHSMDEDEVVEDLTAFEEAVEDNESSPEYIVDARRRIKRRIKTVKGSLKKHMSKIPNQDEVARLERESILLRQYSYLFKEGDLILKIDSSLTTDGIACEIDLDPDLSAGGNIESKFIEFKRAKKSLTLGKEQTASIEKNLFRLQNALDSLQDDMSHDSVLKTLSDLKIARPEAKSVKKDDTKTPYRKYLSKTGAEILVGKGPTENDILTKNAKGNDYWFHVVGVTGSHVVVPKSKFKNSNLLQTLKEEAGILALHFSKVRNNFSGEVYFAQKQNLKKKKGMPAGLWLVEKSDNFFIKYDEEKLADILGRVV